MNDYKNKTEAELRYIIRDASEAADCMKGVDSKAEEKYLDQANDACTELYKHRNKPTPQQEENAELRKLLKEAKALGLNFDIGSAYIRRSYIDKQDDLVKRINQALGES